MLKSAYVFVQKKSRPASARAGGHGCLFDELGVLQNNAHVFKIFQFAGGGDATERHSVNFIIDGHRVLADKHLKVLVPLEGDRIEVGKTFCLNYLLTSKFNNLDLEMVKLAVENPHPLVGDGVVHPFGTNRKLVATDGISHD